MTIGDMAARIDEAYDRLAPQFGYETKKPNTHPDNLRALVTEIVADLLPVSDAIPPNTLVVLPRREADETMEDWIKRCNIIEGVAAELKTATHKGKQIVDQPPPTPVPDGTAIADLVIADMIERKRIGIQRYGTPLQAFNGRDPLVDAYQEALDLAMYLRQAIEEKSKGSQS